MSLREFLKEKVLYITSYFMIAALTVSIIWMLNPAGGPALSLLIGVLYIIGIVTPLTFGYRQKSNFYKNLIAEIINPPSFKEGIILYDIVKGSNKAMLEEINKYRFMEEEYREYIELWVHEIKTPIASSKLIALNNKNEVTDSMSEELERIEAFVEQVLYYSRSNAVEKDYIIKEINLKKLCYDILKKNSRLFIRKNIRVKADNLDRVVFSDAKWLEFIIGQILVNSVKYSRENDAAVELSTVAHENSIVLTVGDNGIGIQAAELMRIFDKGFTGTNGRLNGSSTGMGLYICKKLCDKLGLGISAESTYGEGTTIKIIFPKSSMVDVARG